MHRNNLNILKDKAENPDMYNKFMRQQPNFEACEVLSETSTVPLADDGDEIPEEARMFEELTNAEWNIGHMASIPEIAKKAKSARAHDSCYTNSNLGNEEGKTKRAVRLGKT